MKRRASIVVAALALTLLAGAGTQPARADVSFGFFYSNLSPYGGWAVSTHHGQVWQPYGYGPGWNPYYDGHWVYTDFGWTWVSDYAWGAIPYHYGTWALDPYLGWVWIPGYVWAPSWVVFSSGPDYIGWAPVPPRFVVGATIGFHEVPHDRFVIVPARSFLAPHVRAHVVPGAAARSAIARTRIVNNITVRNSVVVNNGPDRRSIERFAGARVRPVPIETVDRVAPGHKFNREDVRLDRGAFFAQSPRATSPEPVRGSARKHGPARESAPQGSVSPGKPESPRDAASPRRPEAPRGPQAARPSGPEAQRQRDQAQREREQPPRDQAQRDRTQPPRDQAQSKSGSQERQPARPSGAQKQKPAKPQKPPGKPDGR